jgi:hypothetical protein
MPAPRKVSLKSMKELASHEEELLRRLAEQPHGGALFLLDPLRALGDVGAVIEPELSAAIRKRYGVPEMRSPLYDLIREGRAEPPFDVTVKNLFETRG